jgi:uncharacterized membrane protein
VPGARIKERRKIMDIIGWRKLIVAIATLLIQVGCLLLGKELLIASLTAGAVTLIDAILAVLVLLGILSPTALGISYFHYNVEAKQFAKKK